MGKNYRDTESWQKMRKQENQILSPDQKSLITLNSLFSRDRSLLIFQRNMKSSEAVHNRRGLSWCPKQVALTTLLWPDNCKG